MIQIKNTVLEVKHLHKSYTDKKVLENVNLSIYEGEFVALNGENGAGKSTTLHCILGMLSRDSGDIYVSNYHIDIEPVKSRHLVGFSPDDPFLYSYLSGLEHLKLWAGFRGLDEQSISYGRALLHHLGLNDRDLHNLTSTYSKGMKQKLSFIGAIFHKPALIVLDEPFTAMDQDSTEAALQLLESLKTQKCSMLFSSHQANIKNRLADRFLTLKDGHIE
ncbi:ABC transporter ATP-binding protein [Ectobacillus sp. JY-23]|uniref:ABC transporter ATP-binding protein n=1 Tax=Ectobacillus sp. JY-23 TaxID=2933872 RepID=UPI001FF2DF1A|nr:ABC transporter ATP-binding protein [Ectobacillus sp. JY-23]UOY91142.1 ABC transporter ATP-binding protein [Ectobacillus sp. JY-23]